jgi:hypothetical protein
MYEVHYHCDRCKSWWKTYYAEYEGVYRNDVCRKCTDTMEWETLDELFVEPNSFKNLDK